MTSLLIAVYLAAIAGLAVYGLLGYLTLWLFLRHRDDARPSPAMQAGWPQVTVQLPIYNEREVVVRLIAAATALDYPRDRLQIQVLDDSTDDTVDLAAACVAHHRAAGSDIVHLRRAHRRGYKAGALAEALAQAKGEFIAIFDADFVPEPHFLRHTLPFLCADPQLGAVQARWGHLNAADSPLTGAQAIALDKHFAVEQFVRHRADFFPKFNGSAGVWRRACIEAAGGWQADTVCEDLCLSIRAVLAGWRFHFAEDVVAPAELPRTILAYKRQQARWAMGATQCLTKYASPIWRTPGHSLSSRLYALLSMSAYTTHLLLLAMLLVQIPLIMSGYRFPSWMILFTVVGLGQPLLFALAQQVLYPDWRRRLRHLPALLLIAIGSAPSNAWAVLGALLGRRFTFARTPKGAGGSYRLRLGGMLWLEVALAVYSAVALVLALADGNSGPAVFLITCFLGFAYVVHLTWREARHQTLP